MFGNNQKVSSHQLKCLLLLNLISVTSLILPMAVVRICGITGVAAIGAGAILTGFFVLLLYGVMQGWKDSYPEFCKKVFGIPVGNIIMCVYALKYFVAAAFLLAVFAQVVNHTFLTDIPQWVLGIALLIVCTYAVTKGMETRARLGEVLVWIVIVPFVLVLILALPEVHGEWFLPQKMSDMGTVSGGMDGFVWAAILSCACFFTVEWILFHKQKVTYGSVAWGIVWAAVLNIAILLICVSVFSVEGMNGEAWPVVTLMQVVRLPGGFLARQDGLILAFWMVGMFMLISGCFHYGCESIKAVVPVFNRPWKMIFPAVGIFLVFSLISAEDATRLYLNYMIFVCLPLSLGIPLLIYGVRWLRKTPLCILILISSFLLNGCVSQVEIEDRNFVMCLGIDAFNDKLCVSMGFPDLKALTGNGDNIHYDAVSIVGENLEDILDSYHAQNSKRLDFGQLQMIVFGYDMLADQGKMKNVLEYIKKHQEFTRTILVCGAKGDARDIVALDDDVNGSIGIYLRQIFENSYGEYKTTIGDMIISLSNDRTVWDLVIVDKGQGVPVLVGNQSVTYYLETE